MEEIGFEEIYAGAGSDLAASPWADLSPNNALIGWLAGQPAPSGGEAPGREAPRGGEVPSGWEAPSGREALVVGCGLGDDAEELARRGFRVTAFDISPTAIELCRQRFPDSRVQYRVADLFDLPPDWSRAFDVVVEIRTLQSLPPNLRAAAASAIADTVAPGGRIFLRTAVRDPDEPLTTRPWPLTNEELEPLSEAGLIQTELHQEPAAAGRRFKTLTAVYERPS